MSTELKSWLSWITTRPSRMYDMYLSNLYIEFVNFNESSL